MSEDDKVSYVQGTEVLLAHHPKRKLFRGYDGHIDWVQVFLFIITVFIALGFGAIIYLVAFHDNPPMKINDTYTVKDSGRPGELVSFNLDLCVLTGATPVRTVAWENSLSYPVPGSVILPAGLGCVDGVAAMEIPRALPPADDYFIRLIWNFEVNTLRDRSMSIKIGPFTVLEEG